VVPPAGLLDSLSRDHRQMALVCLAGAQPWRYQKFGTWQRGSKRV